MIDRISKILNEPFPSNDNGWAVIRSSVMIGAFIGLFLYVFKPFGFEHEKESAGILAFGYGMVTTVCMLSFQLVCRSIIKLKVDLPSWTFWKWILQCLALITWIAFGNLLLIEWYYPGRQLSVDLWLTVLTNTLLLGLFPIVFSGLIIQVKAAKRYISEASIINESLSNAMSNPIIFKLNANETLTFNSHDLLFAESMQNYVSLAVLQDGTLNKHIIRKPLKDTLNELLKQGLTSVHQCHRSFIVNLNNVSSVGGNAQGLKLRFFNNHPTVPVSRTYLPKIKPLLMTNKP